MSIINVAGASGRAASDSFDGNNKIISQQKQIGRLKEQNVQEHINHSNEMVSQQNQNLQLAQDRKYLLEKVEDLAVENQKYKELLAKPLGQILEENANYKKAYEEQQQLIALWMLRQRAMKKVAVDLAKENNISEQEIVNKSVELQKNVLTSENGQENIVSPQQMQYFEQHRKFLLREINSN